MKPIRHIIISRTDSIGDVILTLPLAKILKDHIPGIRVSFLGKAYTRAVIECCEYVDAFIDLDDFMNKPSGGQLPDAIIHVFPVKEIAQRAKRLGIPLRIGTTGRLYHWTTCNKLVKLSRKNSDLHEAQLNTKLLAPLGVEKDFSLAELGASLGMTRIRRLPDEFKALIDPERFNLILHPRSQGSAREWGLDNFAALINILPTEKFKVFISGTAKEREGLEQLFQAIGQPKQPVQAAPKGYVQRPDPIRNAAVNVTDICGLMDLATFISFINACDGLVANSTGPLHIAAALGKRSVGIYPPIRPMHPGRWQPLGPAATYLVQDKPCEDCRKDPAACHCMKDIRPEDVLSKFS